MARRLREGAQLATREELELEAMGECPHDCVDGHLVECDCAAPAWDLGDLICRSGCEGCCPLHEPAGMKELEHETARRARGMIHP